MFEIRIICDPADTDSVVAALDGTFMVGIVSVYPTRDGRRNRLYARADHKPTPATTAQERPVPTGECTGTAHADADLSALSAIENPKEI
ncbi:hypothetical protein [Streptomyces sp. NPDC051173]|uniref:hypothetical protein n=1 Tax=Streptomyces sp. NPDC051173 TaxID=3155164 RepID=UPI00344BA2D0